MAFFPFGAYAPDVTDYQSKTVVYLNNVVPRADGYGPVQAASAFSGALAAACRGFFKAINTDGTITFFAATSTRIYKMSNTDYTWSDVSLGGSAYTALSSTDNWQFVQFGNFVIAVQANVAPQVFDLTSSSAFAALGGSPPQARYISIVGRFVVLSGLLNNPYRIQWSGLNATTTWTSGTNSSDYQDLPDGGIVRGVAGGEFGYIFQDTAIRRMVYAPGSPVIFQIERISDDRGLYAPYSIVRSGDRVFFLSSHGFMRIDPGTYPTPVGTERVDRTFFADVDRGNLQLLIGASDPKYARVFWAYKSNSGTTGQFDKLICYNYVLDKWSPITMSGEYFGSMSQPGTTLENLDSISTSIDALTASFDSYATSVSPEVALFNTSHVMCFLRGDNLEATLETPASSADNNRIFVQGMRAITDANTGYGKVGCRERWGDTETFTDEQAMDTIGTIPARASTRFARGRLRIPSGTSWTFASGVEAEYVGDGER